MAGQTISALFIKRVTKAGYYRDRGDGAARGLYLQVKPSAGEYSSKMPPAKSWILRYVSPATRKARWMGLGPVDAISLKVARELAVAARGKVKLGVDPLDERKAERAAKALEAASLVTFDECAAEYIAEKGKHWTNPKHRSQWESTLKTHASPVIGKVAVGDVTTAHVVKILRPIWNEIPETASRVRGRIESVLDFATTSEYRTGDNPARWRGWLENKFTAPAKVRAVEHHAALPYVELPAFMAKLREREGVSALALEFTILTAARTGETIGAEWSEFDLAAKVWTIPGSRMKAVKEHVVPLTPRALAILKQAREKQKPKARFVFSSDPRGARPLSNMAMSEMLKHLRPGITTHGFRSSFRDWAAERTNFPRELAEKALAHALKDKTEAAYQRGALLEKRRKLMAAWEGFCAAPAGQGDVVHPMFGTPREAVQA